jgi:AraC-like DNA-binding protein/mannose-6-phosphate isomerase-like protein (cupin superfamily)
MMKEEFIYCPLENSTEILGIDMAGKSYCDGSYHISRQKSEIFVLEYVLSGSGTIIQNGHQYTASAGEIYLLHKGSRHDYYSAKDNPWVKIWINLKGTLIEHLLEVYPLEQVVYPGNDQVLEYFYTFHQELTSGKPPQELQKSCALLLHSILSSLYFGTLSLHQQEPDDALKIKRYLDQHVLDSVTLDDLCDHFFKSKTQIIRQFKKKYGITPYSYLLDIKLQYAKKLLTQTNVPIKEIASRLQFADEHYFSTYFKQVENLSPSLYRSNSRH